jgi:hypothetical protein
MNQTQRRALIKAALEVAKKYPVFPANDKKPCWSNAELGVAKGMGGYKVATQDPAEVKRLFSHSRATEIAVPMGAMSGLICVDVDLHKDKASLDHWLLDNSDLLTDARVHKTRSGGLHYIFRHPGDVGKLPATLRPGVDLKANGTGYICFPPTKGYELVLGDEPGNFPLALVEGALKAKGGTGKIGEGALEAVSDDDLVGRIQDASDLYPALRALSYRLPTRRQTTGESLTHDEQVTILQNLMETSVAAEGLHRRHEDWLDRYGKIPDLVDSAIRKTQVVALVGQNEIDLMMAGPGFMETPQTRPTGPQRETTPLDIETRVAAMRTSGATAKHGGNGSAPNDDITALRDGLAELTLQGLNAETIEPIEWIVPMMIPVASITSIAGTSNVGKTRFMCALLAALAMSDTARMGLPQCTGPIVSIYYANEERLDDVRRRVKAAFRQHGGTKSGSIFVRGKDRGMLRLVALNEIGTPEIDEATVARIVADIRATGAKLITFDPYVSLSDAMDENSAMSASVLTKAFILITALTGCAVLHIHHTPKERGKDADWVRASSDGWRGSGAIYSALDCGFTLSHWMPKNGEQRKLWKANYLDAKLRRWVVLDAAKIREGETTDPVVFELVGQPMADGEGRDIGVCRLSNASEAENALIGGSAEMIRAAELAYVMVERLGAGTYTNMAKVNKVMEGVQFWPDIGQSRGKTTLYGMLNRMVRTVVGSALMVLHEDKKSTNKWSIIIEQQQDENDGP